MTARTFLPLALPVLLLPLACGVGLAGEDDTKESTSSGGAGPDVSGSTGGTLGSPGVGGSGSGGAPPSGSGGSATGGNGNVPGVGGSTDEGSGGSTTTSGNPSPGCGKGGRPAGGKVYEQGVSWLVFPEKYDGNTPLPVLFGFHGCGSGNFGDQNRTEFWDLTRDSGFETDYVVAIPLAASGSCFDYGVDIVRAKALYDDLVENYCVDMDRVFGTGHSSGAGFLMSMLASNNSADFNHFNFLGIAPVSAWLIGSQSTQVATMYIQGVTDSERGGGNGQDVVNKIVDVNECNAGTTTHAVDACNSSHDGASVNAGCKKYDGCDVTSIWCSHDDSAYGGTFHGVPCFYKQAVYDFFESL